MSSITSIRLPDEVSERLSELAARMQRSKSWVINEAIRDYLARAEEDSKRWQETLDALASVKAGDLIDGDQVETWLASWGNEKELEPPR
jgi:predicted transcriptional regulator